MAAQPDDDAVLLARLQRVVKDHPQAKLARLTGRSRTALTRYMQGAKPPLEFGAALARELGINPEWLLTGEGPMYVADMPVASTATGEALLELIRSMDSVARVKLGALTGRAQAKALREISDRLAAYGSLRENLHASTRPVLTELVTALEQALDQRQYDRAAFIEKTASQVERFTEDLELSRRLIQARAHILQVQQQSERAIELQTTAFHALLGSGAKPSEVVTSASSLCVLLRNHGNSGQARRIARMAQAYIGDSKSVGLSILMYQEVMSSIELGTFDGLAELLSNANKLAPAGRRDYVDIGKLYYLVYSGVLQPAEIAGVRQENFPAAGFIMNIAGWTEDPKLLEAALDAARAVMNTQMPLNVHQVQVGEQLLALLNGRRPPAATINRWYTGAKSRADAWHSFTYTALDAQLLRLAGDARARELYHTAERQWSLRPPERTVLPIATARHIRNVLAGIDPESRNKRDLALRRAVAERCRALIASGFGMYRQLEHLL